MKNRIVMGLLCLAPWLGSCSQSEMEDLSSGIKEFTEGFPAVRITVTQPGGTSAILTGVIDYNGGHEIKKRGFVYSYTNPAPRIKESGVTMRLITETTDSFSAEIKNLKNEVSYYARTFIIYGTANDTLYSEISSFIPVARKPQIKTLTIANRVKRAAIVCGQFIESGDGLVSYGICIDKLPCPTLKNIYIQAPDTATDETYRGTFGVFFDDLEENTMYHVRAYAISKTDTVYGNDRVFKTTRGGNFSWGYTNLSAVQAAGIEKSLAIHMDSAMYYYRNYTNLNKYIYTNYNPGTPTADCNIEGWMNMGANPRYQWVGTIQHEMCHALGVGTARNWNSFANPWDKSNATLTLRVMMKDMTTNLYHDGMHFWPAGINQQEEVTNGTNNNKKTYLLKGALMLKANALVINAMREDGLTSY